MIEFREFITRTMLRCEPEKLFVFGDYLRRSDEADEVSGFRGELNAVGIPTRKTSTGQSDALLTDQDFEVWREASLPQWRILFARAKAGGTIVWPSAGIGVGFPPLEDTAPGIAASIERNLAALIAIDVRDKSDRDG
jgi:hypothetical protein